MATFPDSHGDRRFVLRFTPAEWRHLLEDESFLRDAGNSFLPRRLMDIPVQIVPDHRGTRSWDRGTGP